MSDIKQVTNYDVAGSTIIPIPFIYKPDGTRIENYPYHRIPNLPSNVSKIGYCCEPKGIGYPIWIIIEGKTFDPNDPNSSSKFEIGKTGMIEIQPEYWKNVNSEKEEDQQEQLGYVLVKDILVPHGIKFVLDYVNFS